MNDVSGRINMRPVLRFKKRGHMPGLAKKIAKDMGRDPHFFTKCMTHPLVQRYDRKTRSAVCAKAHKLATGIWPGEHGGKSKTGRG